MYRADSVLAVVAAARAGMGVAALPCYLGDEDDQLRRMRQAAVPEVRSTLWLLTHGDLRRTARIRAVMDFLATALGSERVITPEQVRELQGLIEETGTERERVLAYYRVAALSEMTEGSHRRALELLKRKLAKQSSQENGAHAQN